jgi:hypothetical protein
MKGKHIILLVFQLIVFKPLFAQKSVRDSLKNFTISVVQDAMKKGKIKTLAVWDFTDIHKTNSLPGSYISEQFSIYAEKVDSIHIMDRQNLKSILKEHKLKSEGFIDKNTIMELGKFKEVDAVAVGSVIIVGSEFQVIVKVIETTFGETVSAGEDFFPVDKRMEIIFNNPSPAKEEVISPDSLNGNNNSKFAKCYKCKGTGTISVQGTCTNCNGTGTIACPKCSGKGSFLCSACNGSGEAPFGPNSNWEKRPCKTCSGTGKINCKSCSGKGSVTCDVCNGKKIATTIEICPICNGTGEILKDNSVKSVSVTINSPCISGNGSLKILNKSFNTLSIIVSDEKVDLINNRMSKYEVTTVSSNSNQIVPDLKPGAYFVCLIDSNNSGFGNPVLQTKKIMIEGCKEAQISF